MTVAIVLEDIPLNLKAEVGIAEKVEMEPRSTAENRHSRRLKVRVYTALEGRTGSWPLTLTSAQNS